MPIHCKKCGVRVASRAALSGHYRKAHRGARQRRPGRVQGEILAGIVPARRDSAPARPARERVETLADAELVARFGRPTRPVLDVTPTRSEIVLAPRNILTLDLRDAERPPSWWEPQADLEWRVRQWNVFPADYRNRLLAQRAGAAFTIRAPQAKGEVVLWSQYHALKALATRLDAGIGSARERVAFEAGLREYNANYDRIVQMKALPD